jgi:hypothetical protein
MRLLVVLPTFLVNDGQKFKINRLRQVLAGPRFFTSNFKNKKVKNYFELMVSHHSWLSTVRGALENFHKKMHFSAEISFSLAWRGDPRKDMM